MSFKKILQEELKGRLSDEELKNISRGFQTLGKVIIVKLNPILHKKKELIGESYLKLLPAINSVYLNKGKIEGDFRTPEKIEFLAGIDDPVVKHKEHGVVYELDITRIMFSKGNLYERKYLASLVQDDEIIVDMFAGIGYFSLPIAIHSKVAKIYSIEMNPEAYKFLLNNIKLNHLEKEIIPILGDSKIEVLKLSKDGIRADRVIMGVFPAPIDFIKEALTLTSTAGTIFHFEGVVDKEDYISLFNEFKEIAIEENFLCELKSKRFVKSYGPNLYHTTFDISCVKKPEVVR